MIAATFQPTSQGCCGDTVISKIVHVVMRREPPLSPLQTLTSLLSPAAPASLLLAFVSLFLFLLHQGASLTSAESLEHFTRQLQTYLLATVSGEGLPGPLLTVPQSPTPACPSP